MPPVPHRLRAALALLAVAGALPGCMTDQGRLPIVATRPVQLDLRDVDTSRLAVQRDVTGSDTRVTSVLFLPTGESPRLENAVENALLEYGGDVMVRVRVRAIDWWFLIGVSTLEVRGDVIDLVDVE